MSIYYKVNTITAVKDKYALVEVVLSDEEDIGACIGHAARFLFGTGGVFSRLSDGSTCTGARAH